jgi:hypothetical protein
MHRERQRQCQAQPPHFRAAEPQRIKSWPDSGHILKDCLRKARPATVFTTWLGCTAAQHPATVSRTVAGAHEWVRAFGSLILFLLPFGAAAR